MKSLTFLFSILVSLNLYAQSSKYRSLKEVTADSNSAVFRVSAAVNMARNICNEARTNSEINSWLEIREHVNSDAREKLLKKNFEELCNDRLHECLPKFVSGIYGFRDFPWLSAKPAWCDSAWQSLSKVNKNCEQQLAEKILALLSEKYVINGEQLNTENKSCVDLSLNTIVMDSSLYWENESKEKELKILRGVFKGDYTLQRGSGTGSTSSGSSGRRE